MSDAFFTERFDWAGWSRLTVRVIGLAMTAAVAGCASFKPDSLEQVDFLQRPVHSEDPEFRVSVAVPSIEESARYFDRRLDRQGVQAVWVRVVNRTDSMAFFLPNAMDNEYFAPLEVAYPYHSGWRPARNAALDAYFLTNAMPDRIPERSERSGFVYTHLDLGEKQVCVSISRRPDRWHEKRFTFLVAVPGLKTDWQEAGWRYLTNGVPEIECDETRLRTELEKLPRATRDKAGRKEGDPLNLVMIGSLQDLAATAGCEWDATERVTSGTAWRTLKSFLFGIEYRYSPVSPLYYEGRPQDIALQKARSSVKQRNHLRLWLTSLRYNGKPVWVGQISRDIGVRWTLKTINLTTHKINPNVDESRAYLVGDLVHGQAVKWWGFVKGAEAAPYWEPRHNLTGDPYFTDGLRVVLELSAEAVKPTDARLIEWETPPNKSIVRDSSSAQGSR